MLGEDPPEGRKWRSQFRLSGLAPRPDVPIYLAGLSPKMLELAGEIADDVGAVRETLRGDCIPYFGLPFYRAMIERSGFAEDIAAFDRAAAAGDFEAMKPPSATSS